MAEKEHVFTNEQIKAFFELTLAQLDSEATPRPPELYEQLGRCVYQLWFENDK